MSRPPRRKYWTITGTLWSRKHTDAFSLLKDINEILEPHGLKLTTQECHYAGTAYEKEIPRK